ncbi:ABC transporter permease [Leifsonia xyli]|uniref:ABC transporter permease n=1 Tax=Leifsonia xyli TaxID=1575 RepID=UPI003D66BD07
MTAAIPQARSATASRWWRSALHYGVKWIVGPILTIVAAAFVIYIALALSPGDPVSTILGSKATAEQRQALRERLGLDEPVLVQFWNWFTSALHGDFGFSFTFRQDVSTIVGPRLGTTAALVVMSMVLILVFGIGLGIVGGIAKKSRALVSTTIGFLISIPSFVAASFLIGIFAVGLGWFPTFGAGEPGIDRIWHLTLPAIALAVGWVAYLAQISMSSITEERNKEHVTTAIGRGLPFGLVLRKHILRNAGIPVLTASGLTLAALVAGSIVVETAFAVDGIGSLLVKSVLSKDQPVVAAISLIIITVFVVMTTVVDILQVVLDPKLRKRSRR